MNDELKNAASPYNELLKVAKQQDEKLGALCVLKNDQNVNDNQWRELWAIEKEERKQQQKKNLRQKRVSAMASVTALFFTAAAFYLNVIKLDEESALIRAFAVFFNAIAGVF